MADGKKAAKALKDADKRHYNQVEKYVKVVDGLYTQAVGDLSALAVRIGLPEDDSTFEFPKSKQNEVQKVVKQLADRITATIMVGDRNEWNAACTKFDDFVETVLNTSKLSRKQLAKYEARNLEALSAFQQRKVDGLDLSERVWKTVQPFKDEVELAIDTATGEGKSAAELSRDVRSCLKDPDKLFRRVRDKYGNLHLSKAAKLYHPGQGVYRSSYKNAMRVTRSEINMAYRQSDHMRWQQLDFVVGIQVQTSNNHTCLGADGKPHRFTDICDELAGKYPKDFKFVGWHPQCRCFATPILKTLDEVEEEIDEEGNYRDLPSANEVKDVPDNFKQYIADNAARIEEWQSMPYYIKDNPQYIDEILHPEKYVVKAILETQRIKTPRCEATNNAEAIAYVKKYIADDCTFDFKKVKIEVVNDVLTQMAQRMEQFNIKKFKVCGSPHNAKVTASYDDYDNSFNINWNVLANTKSAWQKLEKWRAKGIRYDSVADEADIIRSTIDHELGHKLLRQYDMKNEAMKVMGKCGVSVPLPNGKMFNELYDVIGHYGSTSVDEFFAECVATYFGPRRGEMKMTKELVESMLKKIDGYVIDGEISKADLIKAAAEKRHAARTAEDRRRIQQRWDERKKNIRIEAMIKEMPDNLNAEQKKAIAKNNVEIEDKLNIRKGKPMTINQADEQSANPNYKPKMIPDPNGLYYDPQGNRFDFNPQYKKEFSINCATCSPAYAMRLRGFNFTAKPNIEKTLNSMVADTGGFEVWKNADGTPVKPVLTLDWMRDKGYKEMTENRYLEYFDETCKEPGVYILTIRWKGEGAHATILHRDESGNLFRVEPQVFNGNAKRTLDELCVRGSVSPQSNSGILRVDDKVFDTDWLELFYH